MLNVFRRFAPKQLKDLYRIIIGTKPLTTDAYRIVLFNELIGSSGGQFFSGKRILEIGPKDGLDSVRLSRLHPKELIMIDLPEKHDTTKSWLSNIECNYRFIERNFMYQSEEQYAALHTFDLIWCTGVLYHNAEQLRFLKKLFKLLNPGGYLVMESATLRGEKHLMDGAFVQIYWPDTYRNTSTVTHLPSKGAILAWLKMVGFSKINVSDCFKENRQLGEQRIGIIAQKSENDDAGSYYTKSGLNPEYLFGDSL